MEGTLESKLLLYFNHHAGTGSIDANTTGIFKVYGGTCEGSRQVLGFYEGRVVDIVAGLLSNSSFYGEKNHLMQLTTDDHAIGMGYLEKLAITHIPKDETLDGIFVS